MLLCHVLDSLVAFAEHQTLNYRQEYGFILYFFGAVVYPKYLRSDLQLTHAKNETTAWNLPAPSTKILG